MYYRISNGGRWIFSGIVHYDLMYGACVHFQCLLVLPMLDSVMPS